jgi:hypothetical protein
MAEETTLFQSIDYIVNICENYVTANNLDDCVVYNGPPTGDGAERIQILVAYNDEEGGAAVNGTAGTSDFGVPVEEYDIDCSISISDGDPDLEGKQGEVRALFNSLVGAIRDDKKFGGILGPTGIAEITGFVFSQDHDTDNSYVVGAFSVGVRGATIWNG